MSCHVISAIQISFRLKNFKHFLGGNNKTVVLLTGCLISDLFGKRKPLLGSLHASLSIGFPCQINQISDSS